MSLTLRPTRFGDDLYEDDFIVLSDGQEVGRIVIQAGVPMGRPNWFWGIILPGQPQPSDWRGMAASLNDAKAAFKARWERINDSR